MKLNIEDYLYHGIIDWCNYNKIQDEKLCLEKLASILKSRHILRPCDFKKYNVKHLNWANPYTHYYTFVSFHPSSMYADIFKKDIKEFDGYTVATKYANFGLLLSPRMVDELDISFDTFCDKEIPFTENISLDKYLEGIFVNDKVVSRETIISIREMLKKFNYNVDIVSILDGKIIDSRCMDKAKKKIK